MAYVSTEVLVSESCDSNRRYATYKITETDISPTDEWSIAVPSHATLTLIEATLTTPGSAATIKPEFGVVAGWTTALDGHIDAITTAAATVRSGCDKRWATRDGNLYGRSIPNIATGASGVITTYVTFAWGHR